MRKTHVFTSIEDMVAYRERNCDQCMFSHRPGQSYSMEKMITKVSQGLECELKYGLHTIDADMRIDSVVAEALGYRGGGLLPRYCRKFMPRYIDPTLPGPLNFFKKMWPASWKKKKKGKNTST